MTTSEPATIAPRGLERDERGSDLTPQGRRIVRISLVMLAVLSTGSMIGNASWFYLVNELPLVLLVLSPVGRNLILTSTLVDPVVFVSVASLRRMLFYLPCFMLGRTLGQRGIEWIEQRAPLAERFLRWLERIFERARYPAIFFLIGPMMATIAGNSGMSLKVWVPIVAGGLVFRMIITVLFGEWAREPIEWLLALVDEYKLPGTIVMVGSIVVWQVWSRRRR